MTPERQQVLLEAAKRVVTETSLRTDVVGDLRLAVHRLEAVIRSVEHDAAKGRVTSQKLDQRLRHNRDARLNGNPEEAQ